MTIDIKTWTVKQIRDAKLDGTLRIDQDYQRREVWKLKHKMLLVDSLARDVPIGAVTFYADDSKGYTVYEVIDGKQRISSLLEFENDEFAVQTVMLASAAVEEDEFSLDGDPIVAEFHGRKFSSLETPTRIKFGQYEIPVFVVTGSRAAAIRAFTRMNGSNYALKPQEIRNAFFAGTYLLQTAIMLCEEVSQLTSDGTSLFVALGAITPTQFSRMHDIQLCLELLTLLVHGPQHRRDTLDDVCEEFRIPSASQKKRVDDARDELRDILAQVWSLFEGSTLLAYHFPSVEHDLYGLVGALHSRGRLTKPQLDAGLGAEVVEVLKGFFGRVQEYRNTVLRPGEGPAPEFEEREEEYGRGYFTGQINSMTRRQTRIAILRDLLTETAATLDPKSQFSAEQRRLIWARSPDKRCARCGEVVPWPEYHAGHKVPHGGGGKTTVDNGQVEHAKCNMSAGAS